MVVPVPAPEVLLPVWAPLSMDVSELELPFRDLLPLFFPAAVPVVVSFAVPVAELLEPVDVFESIEPEFFLEPR